MRRFWTGMLVLGVVLAGSTVAQAKEQAGTAKLAAPVAAQVKVVADGAIWTCAADTCVARVPERITVSGCKDMARKLGALSAYAAGIKELSADQITACNTAAPAR